MNAKIVGINRSTPPPKKKKKIPELLENDSQDSVTVEAIHSQPGRERGVRGSGVSLSDGVGVDSRRQLAKAGRAGADVASW